LLCSWVDLDEGEPRVHASKGALESITPAFADELGPRKIRVNAISPGLVDTEGVRAAGVMESPEPQQYAALSPFGRIGQPSDIATVAVFLASSDSGWITGETLRVQAVSADLETFELTQRRKSWESSQEKLPSSPEATAASG
jgi:NAD(P)-dependent dehydrogenase (short-subunit alcohol dehydrogenase family)